MNEKIKVLINFIKKQIEDQEKLIKEEIYTKSKKDLNKKYKIRTAESDLIIEFYNNGLVKIKGNGLKKFEVKTNINEPMLIVEQGKEIITISDQKLQEELLNIISFKIEKEPMEEFIVLTYD